VQPVHLDDAVRSPGCCSTSTRDVGECRRPCPNGSRQLFRRVATPKPPRGRPEFGTQAPGLRVRIRPCASLRSTTPARIAGGRRSRARAFYGSSRSDEIADPESLRRAKGSVRPRPVRVISASMRRFRPHAGPPLFESMPSQSLARCRTAGMPVTDACPSRGFALLPWRSVRQSHELMERTDRDAGIGQPRVERATNGRRRRAITIGYPFRLHIPKAPSVE